MKNLPRYTKVLTLGSSRTENALEGPVIIQEKVDGSQFRFGRNEDGDFALGSRSVNWVDRNCDGMFNSGVSYLRGVKDRLTKPDTYFFCEYLSKPKHNTLCYERTPKNYFVLFDVMEHGKWVDRITLEAWAELLDIEVVPELFSGIVGDNALDFFKELHKTDSFLGKEKIEGVVIKNYNQNIDLGGVIFPLFTKYVREEYKERHGKEWKSQSPKTAVNDFINSFQSEARWTKAISHLRDQGLIEKSPRDIGVLIKAVQKDVIEECEDDIKKYFYDRFIKDILRRSTSGLPEWYKEKLVRDMEE